MDEREEALAIVEATVFLRDGGSATVRCRGVHRAKIHGATVHPFETPEGQMALFVKADPAGNLTNYDKASGETDGKSFFHYMFPKLKGRCHFKDGDWTNLVDSNWEMNAKLYTKQERRFRRAMNQQAAHLT